MTEFIPPISDRETDELIEIANCKDENIWQKEAIKQAKKELIKRNISQEQQNKISKEKKTIQKLEIEAELQRLENNKTESYTVFEMVILFLFGPLIFFNIFGLSHHTIFTLSSENYFLKLKQRILIFVLSFSAWFIYLNYSSNKSEEKRLEEIEKIDISDWKKRHGY
ncbi:hypothetical protein L3X37_13570 [Sabulilitoribacter arenilitoris]|uniref:Uncharacterized protein n=1 Tax=Wocania arenilitoris TaxID=2044858 RepID=A0AAE3JLK9_9FLAO|nr:hypothetical protein [Wocania arenilitoris]MCF7569378.1 hypothetical protein [Wocania arenilitoris]